MSILKIVKKFKTDLIFAIFGILNSFITFAFYYYDLIGLTAPLLTFLILCYHFGKEKNFWKYFENKFLIFFGFWLLFLTILINF